MRIESEWLIREFHVKLIKWLVSFIFFPASWLWWVVAMHIYLLLLVTVVNHSFELEHWTLWSDFVLMMLSTAIESCLSSSWSHWLHLFFINDILISPGSILSINRIQWLSLSFIKVSCQRWFQVASLHLIFNFDLLSSWLNMTHQLLKRFLIMSGESSTTCPSLNILATFQ